MKIALAALLAMAGTASAGGLDEWSQVQSAHPSTQLFEASCDMSVELAGAVASVEVRQRIANPGPVTLAASYEFELPKGAVVTSVQYKAATGTDTALAVPVGAPAVPVSDPDVLGADPVFVRSTGNGVYHAVIEPIAPDHEVALVTRYTAIAEPRAGALRLVFPPHVTAGKLTVCRGTVHATPGPGATVTGVRVDGAAGGHNMATFTLDARELVVDVDLEVAGTTPVVWTQTQSLADGWSASLVTVLGPRVKAAGARRVVFLVDGSKSMELVGRANVGKVVHALGAALPAGAEVEAILFDRTAARVFGDIRPANPANLAAIEQAIAKRGAGNGTDVAAAFELAGKVIAGARGQAMVIVVTDGVIGDLAASSLVKALGSTTSAVDVHAVVVDPATTRSPGADVLRAPVNLYGGAYVEVSVDALDGALAAIDEWMRPSWLELRLTDGTTDIAAPTEVRAGAGFTRLAFHRAPPNIKLVGHGDAQFDVTGKAGPAAPIAALAIGHATPQDLAGGPDALDDAVARAKKTLEHAIAAVPVIDEDHALAVLAPTGRIAKSRRAMIAGGGRYERSIALADPQGTNIVFVPAPAPATASAIAKLTLERLFRDQLQPRAYACYQRALGLDSKLEGTVHYQFRLGRGEVTEVQLLGTGNKAFDDCLVDAGYALTPPLPDFTVNVDDQTIANYPIHFARRAEQAQVVLGDADSSSPIDIDAIPGGVPGSARRGPINTNAIDTRTPLGKLRPPKSP